MTYKEIDDEEFKKATKAIRRKTKMRRRKIISFFSAAFVLEGLAIYLIMK